MNTINQGTYKPLGIIKSNLIPLTILLTFGLILFACNENHNPVSESTLTQNFSSPAASAIGVNTESVVIQNFKITFNENKSVYDEDNDQTTFNYTVTRLSDAQGFNFLFFETPECAGSPLKFTPETGEQTVKEIETDIGTEEIDGIKWTASIGSDKSRDYSITYSGNQSTGMTYATIQGTGSSGIETKEIPGPCKGVHTISGFIYVDEENYGTKDPGEAGIGNVLVQISNGNEEETTTSSDGSYTFHVYTGGTDTDFTLKVRDRDDDDYFNKTLFENFTLTQGAVKNDGSCQDVLETDGCQEVTVGKKDVKDINFGFKPETGRIIERFENPDKDDGIKLQTEKPKFWANQFKFATKNRDMVFSKNDLRDFLKFELIKELDLTYSFDFKDNPDDDDIKKAEQILTLRGNSTDFEKLRAELLAAMLNVVSGGGAVKEACSVLNNECVQLKDFNDLILKVGAAAAVRQQTNNGSSLMMNSTTHETTTFTITSQSLSSGDLLRSFNGGGGGVGN